MISKNRIKQIHALVQHKQRNIQGLFVAEGPKVVEELLKVFKVEYYGSTSPKARGAEPLTREELERVSLMKAPQECIAVFRIPEWQLPSPDASSLMLALDGVQDPGNLGTIIRLADWFGIEHVVCSKDTVDVWNPKVVQATMGALSRVQVHYTDLASWVKDARNNEIPVYGTFLDGENMYDKTLTDGGIIVMGNEGKGISTTLSQLINERLFIPSYPPERTTSESLNVATATAIVCAEFRRRLAR